MSEEIKAKSGSAWECAMVPDEKRLTPDQTATIAAWIMQCPGWSPAWDKFLLCCVHLRQIEGVKPAVFTMQGATHEIMLVALDPTYAADPDDIFSDKTRILHPINIVQQFIVNNDDQAIELTKNVAMACIQGILPIEPQGIRGAREYWESTILTTAQHIRDGCCSEDSATKETIN